MAKLHLIDPRTAAEITQQVNELLATYLPAAPSATTPVDDPIRRALVGVFAHFAEAIIQRLNQVPQKNFLAFLNLLGASRLPPQPARVPLTFFLATGSTVDGVVPAGTQVAAPPAEGEKDPTVFETERELVVTSAQLESVFIRDPERDQYANYSELTRLTSDQEVAIFRGDRQVQHIVYLGHSQLFSFPNLRSLAFVMNLSKPLEDGATVQWQIWNGRNWQNQSIALPGNPANPLMSADPLQQTGEIIITFNNLTAASDTEFIPASVVNGKESRWMRGVLTPAIAPDPEGKALFQLGRVRSTKLPIITSIQLLTTIANSGLTLEAALMNQIFIEFNKPFYPFGEKPKFGDVFYFANQEAFSKNGATVTLNITIVNPVDYLGVEQRVIDVNRSSQNPTLSWEIWDEQHQTWVVLGISDKTTATPKLAADFQDGTKALTQVGKNLAVRFTLPKAFIPKRTDLNGVENFWIRVRIAKGDYGKDASYEERRSASDTQPGIYALKSASFVPPVIESLTIDYTLTLDKNDNITPEAIITENNSAFRVIKDQTQSLTPFSPFEAIQDAKSARDLSHPTLYLGFTLPSDRLFPTLPLSLYVQTAAFRYGERPAPLSPPWSKQAGTAGASVNHTFWLVNSGTRAINFTLSLVGMRQDVPWPTAISEPTSTQLTPSLQLAAGEVKRVVIQVTIPQTVTGGSDRGTLQIVSMEQPEVVYSATFETFAGQLPKSEQVHFSWQYWAGLDWRDLLVQDGSKNFTRSGLIEFLPPADLAPHQDFGQGARYWIRVQWDAGDYDVEPRLQRLLLNTTIAAQTITLRNEILGSSNGSENQIVRTTKAPVLQGQQLQVREPELPSGEELAQLQAVENPENSDSAVISQVLDASGRPQEIWVRWQEVPDFYGSGPRDRHYVLDHITGEIHFGNGVNGLIPPIGKGNLRMTHYQTGGGSNGNRPTGTIVQLKTTVPYVDQVINPEPATGGADAETLESLMARSPRSIRHRERAVTLEDYEDLAMLASPAVARAKCVPLRNLATNPTDQKSTSPGEVSVIIVPASLDAKPLPSLELISRVQDYLQSHSLPTVNVSVVGPLYVQASIVAEVALASLEVASEVEKAVVQGLIRFLHPLTGGFEGTGWEFGREPHKSDFYRLLESIPGVDHVRSLQVDDGSGMAEVDAIKATQRFLVYSGQHTITLTFGDS